ncbi:MULTISPECIES: acyltransferase [unclassified Streptomyces]|uniref:acyltransferase family protein n=1 Tax=unclassified Streptomyces TaxID=2593676 RepID=UPI000DBAA8FF|nr:MULTISPECIES: acyltransferase [unclassified Streptomyces]MYT71243.1 acyltransferase family protein [Streptomyces sp. SID8367]RAJ72510.1 peptidoglycan/LPS O-acetylase OafA/YrhL [Streptomyces sp. PsTaAH-137]
MTSALLPSQPALRPRAVVTRADRLDSLTGLRFLAALAVFTHHFTGASPSGGVAHTPALFPYSTMGVNGVGFFFVLSGFLLAWGHRSGTPAKTFYWRRAGRVLPLHLAATIPCLWVFHLWGGVPWDLPSFLASLVLVQTWFPGVVPMFPGNGVSWTLSVEAFFYLLFPLVIRAAYRLRTRTLFALCAAGLLAMWAVGFWAATHLSPFHSEWVMRLPVARLPEFALGTSLALAVGRGLRIPVRPGPLAAVFAAYTVVYAHRGDWFGPGVVQQLDCSVRPLVALFSGLLIVACVRRERSGTRGWLCAPLMVKLGAWSYAFYLLHQTVNRYVLDHWGRAAPGDQNVFTLIGVATVVVALSWAAYTYVEEPARRWWYRRQPT